MKKTPIVDKIPAYVQTLASHDVDCMGGLLKGFFLKEHPTAFLALGEMFNLQELKDMAETELLIQLDKENMVAMISIGEIFRADEILEAALKMTKANMAWLRSQVL